uniref:Uncharacterized protein n=1 Tax=Rhizophora mucronata TaxID=61149 RepID=A0A2P2QG64_RHIMU
MNRMTNQKEFKKSKNGHVIGHNAMELFKFWEKKNFKT